MSITIRTGTNEDYAAVVALRNRTTPELAISVEKWQADDAARPAHCVFGLLCAERDGELVGYARYAQYADLYQPGKFFVNVCVAPEAQRDGLATRLLQALEAALEPLNPQILRATVREDRKGAMIWAMREGFKEISSRYTSELKVKDFDCRAYDSLIEQLAAAGIELRPVSDLRADPRHIPKLHDLFTRVDADVPMADTTTALSRDQFIKQVLEAPYFNADGSFVAVDVREYIGLNFVFKMREGVLDIDLTGTERGYRRRGIATALKVKGIEYAQKAGFHTICTTNDATNAAIISINDRMGFVRRPALVQFVKTLKEA